MIPSSIDFEVLRTFEAVCRLGSLSRAAERLGRSQSALSMQMRRLEDVLGQTLFRRTGRGVTPTMHAELLLGYIVRILALGDEAAARLSAPVISGTVRVGLPEELTLASLPKALGGFRGSHRGVTLEVLIDTTAAMEPLWQEGKLDVMIAAPASIRTIPHLKWSVVLNWVCGSDHVPSADQPLDIVLFAAPCTWRECVLAALAESGRTHKVTFTSPSMAAVQAAVESGLGITLLTPECVRAERMAVVPQALAPSAPVTVQYGLFVRPHRTAPINGVIDALLGAIETDR